MRMSFLAALLAVFAALVSAPARAEPYAQCHNGSWINAFDRRFTPMDCELVHEFRIPASGASGVVRLIRPTATTMGDPAPVVAKIQTLLNEFGRALNLMPGAVIGNVTMMFTDATPPSRELSHAWHIDHNYGLSQHDDLAALRAEECVMPFYKQDEGMTQSQFAFTMAHEMFHCVQFFTWYRQMLNYPAAAWWVEAIAEYFAELAMPGTTESNAYVRDFDAAAGSSLVDLNYPAVVFFAWYAGKHGPGSLVSFEEAMALNPTRSSQLGALQLVLTTDEWLSFEQDYLDGKIKFPDAAGVPTTPIPSTPQEGMTVTISGATQIAQPSPVYSVQHKTLVFEQGRAYAAVVEDAPGDALTRWSETPSEWTDPVELISACDAPRRYRAVWGTTRSEDAGHLKVTVAATGASCCLVGVWQMSSESLEHNIVAIKGRTCAFTGGRMRLNFSPDETRQSTGTGLYAYDDVAFQCRPSEGGYSQSTINGSAQTNYHVVETSSTLSSHQAVGKVLFLAFPHVGARIGTIHTETHSATRHYPNAQGEDGVTVPFRKDEPLMWGPQLGPYLGGRFECTANRLHIDPPPGYPLDPEYSFDYIRLSAPPRH